MAFSLIVKREEEGQRLPRDEHLVNQTIAGEMNQLSTNPWGKEAYIITLNAKVRTVVIKKYIIIL